MAEYPDDEASDAAGDTPDRLYGDPDTATSDNDDSKPWLDLIVQYNKAGYEDFNTRADNIDKQFADADRLASITRDKQFQIFWANIQVLKPSIYSRPPVPVVVPRFRDRDPLKRITSELLERCLNVGFELEDVDALMRELRDDLVIPSRGVAWVRYEAKSAAQGYVTERVCFDYVNRRDFAHDPARIWKEVDWVAKRSWLTQDEMKDRFEPTSGDAYKNASYAIRKGQDNKDDGKLKAGVWELWCKSANRVVWVTDGVEDVLDSGKPHLTLDGFFPLPRPVYGTKQRGSLLPVADFLYYKDQIEEINSLTNRISALSEALRLKGFYPAGAGEIGDAIQAAVKSVDDNAILIPVANWAMIGSGGVDGMIVWLPLDMIAKTVTELVQLRKQLIDDVYQITGLSDIMRGDTEAAETLGAQKLKSQYGSIRIKDRTDELVRVARDLVRIAAEIMAENFQQKTLADMAQMDIPSRADIAKQIADLTKQGAAITAQLQKAQADPQVQALIKQHPDEAQQLVQTAQQQIQQFQQQAAALKQQPTIEDVMELLQDEKTRSFTIDIETDSTIAPDEDATKQRATEFMTAVGGFMESALPLVQAVPQAATLVSEMLKYVASQFRAGRDLEGAIDDFADQMKQTAQQPKPPTPEEQAAQTKQQIMQQQAQIDAQAKQQDAQQSAQKFQQESQHFAMKAQGEIAVHQAQVQGENAKTAATVAATERSDARAADAHAQSMQAGALDLHMKKLQIRHQQVTTRATMMGAAQKMAGAAQSQQIEQQQAASPQGDEPTDGTTASPAQAAPAPSEDDTEFSPGEIMDFEQQTTQAFGEIASVMKEIAATLTAPVEIIKDAAGSPVGVRRGGVVKQVRRDPITGDVAGLN